MAWILFAILGFSPPSEMTHWFIRWWFCLMKCIWANLKFVRFSPGLPSESLSSASLPGACDCTCTLFRSSAVSCSAKPRIGCDRPVGLTQSVVHSSPLKLKSVQSSHRSPYFHYHLSSTSSSPLTRSLTFLHHLTRRCASEKAWNPCVAFVQIETGMDFE